MEPSRCILARFQNDVKNEITLHSEFKPDMPEFPFKVYPLVTLGEDHECRNGVFEVDAFCEEGKDIALGILVSPKPLSYYDRTNPNPTDPWSMRFLEVSRWIISKPISEPRDICLKTDAFNHLKYTVSDHTLILEINGEIIDTVELPYYPAMGSVVTDTDEEVIIKIVNFADDAESVGITLDCDVESAYTVNLMTGNATDENSLEAPENVSDKLVRADGASRSFVYEAPALSVSALRLKKLN